VLSPSAVAAVRDAARAVLAGDDAPAFRLPADVTADAFVQATDRHRLMPFFSLNLDRLDLADDLRATIAARGQRERMPALMMARELFRAVDALSDAGVRVLTFKGIALAQQAYGDFTARGSGDLDLLVSPDDLVTARTALVNAGWAADPAYPEPGPSWAWRFVLRNSYELPLYSPRSSIDLHWHPAPAVTVLPGFNELWSQRSRVEFAGGAVDSLCEWDGLRHSCNHASKDDWSWLRSCVDVWQLAHRVALAAPEALESLSKLESRSLGVVVHQFDSAPSPLSPGGRRLSSAATTMRYVERAERRQLDPSAISEGRVAGQARVLRVVRSRRGARSPRDSYRIVVTSAVLPNRLGGISHPTAFSGLAVLLRREVARVRRSRLMKRAGKRTPPGRK